jgi:hypothetical protein
MKRRAEGLDFRLCTNLDFFKKGLGKPGHALQKAENGSDVADESEGVHVLELNSNTSGTSPAL